MSKPVVGMESRVVMENSLVRFLTKGFMLLWFEFLSEIPHLCKPQNEMKSGVMFLCLEARQKGSTKLI